MERGQRLGRLGNSGNTDAPHLHFHVMDSPSALNSDGLPFVFDRMILQGRLAGTLQTLNDDMLAGKAVPVDRADSGPRSRQMPLSLDVVAFE